MEAGNLISFTAWSESMLLHHTTQEVEVFRIKSKARSYDTEMTNRCETSISRTCSVLHLHALPLGDIVLCQNSR
jgi:hypothetical protein